MGFLEEVKKIIKKLDKLFEDGITFVSYEDFNKNQLDIYLPLYLVSKGYFVVMITPLSKHSEIFSRTNGLMIKMRKFIIDSKLKGFELKERTPARLTHENGGRLVIKSCNPNARGYHANVLIIKDAHLIDNFEVFWSCVYPISFMTNKFLMCGRPTKGGLFEEILNKKFKHTKLNNLKKDFFKKIQFD